MVLRKESSQACLDQLLIEVSLNKTRKTLKRSLIKNGKINMDISITKILSLERL
nr:MAG TPA: hypothetical protein [Caudoviricetes sp.]